MGRNQCAWCIAANDGYCRADSPLFRAYSQHKSTEPAALPIVLLAQHGHGCYRGYTGCNACFTDDSSCDIGAAWASCQCTLDPAPVPSHILVTAYRQFL